MWCGCAIFFYFFRRLLLVLKTTNSNGQEEMGRSVHSMTCSKKCIQIHHHAIIGFCFWVALVCSAGLGWNGQIIFLDGLALLYGCEFGDRKKNCSQQQLVIVL
jgi:hypothetical protein